MLQLLQGYQCINLNKMNKFNIKNKYSVKANFDSNKNVVETLSYFYLPLIGIEGFSLYLFLLREASNPSIMNKFIFSSRIVDYLNTTSEKIIEAILNLEKLGLIEIYQDNKVQSKLIYVLNEPLNYNELNKTKQLISILTQKIGKENIVLSTDYLDSTVFIPKDQTLLENQVLFEVKKDYENKMYKINYSDLFSILDNLKINYNSFWNIKIEEIIKNFVVLNKAKMLDIARVFKYLLDNKIDIVEENIVKTFYLLNGNIKTKEIFINKIEMMKNIDPIEFSSITLERKLTLKEKELINNLLKTYGFNVGIINLLIDYSLIVNDGIIVSNYIYKIADTILQQEMNNFDLVMNYLKDSYKAKKHIEKNSNKEKPITNSKPKSKSTLSKEKITEIEEFYDDDFWGDL